ncbi:MAG: TonB-dependent receptor [Pseudomonadota bacterium]
MGWTKFSLWGATAIAAALTVTGGSAWAQDADEPLEIVVVPSITVTARKVEEPDQKVPFGLTVIGEDRIERDRIRDARSFGREVPGFNYTDSGSVIGNFPNVRGVGSFFPQSSDDSSVPVFIDGIPLAVRAQDLEYFDIERVEILKGPQNSVFGRNAQAGLVSVTTADPTDEVKFELGAEYGNFDQVRVLGLASGPLSDVLFGRVSAQFENREGDTPDLNLGFDTGRRELTNAAVKLIWGAGPDTTFKLSARYGTIDTGPAGGVVGDPTFPATFVDFEPTVNIENTIIGLTVEHDFGPVQFTSVSGYLGYETELVNDDTDGIQLSALLGIPPAFAIDPGQNFRVINDDDTQLTQEFRLNGTFGDDGQWLVGVNVFRSDFDFDFFVNRPPAFNADYSTNYIATSLAGFGEVTIPVTDRFRAVLGGRYAREKRDIDSVISNPPTFGPFALTVSGDETFNLFTGRAALSYDIVETVTGYVTVARGAKAGGFNLADLGLLTGGSLESFDPAFTLTYEGGVRGSLFERAVDFNASVFFNDTVDEQLQVFDLASFTFEQGAFDVETYGLEFELTVRPAEGLTLSGGVALLETEITKSEDPTIAVGNEVPFAPQVAFNLAAQYVYPVDVLGSSGELFGRAEYQFVGERQTDPQNATSVDSFSLVNFRLGYDDERFSIYGFVDNALDEEYAESGFTFADPMSGNAIVAGNRGEPRRYGVGGKLRF